jgi:hypothetical protein
MRLALVFALAFSSSVSLAQPDLWSHVSTQPGPQRLEPATLSSAQQKALAHLLRHLKPGDVWECEGPDLDDMIKGLTFQTLPIPGEKDIILAAAPAGCARGGQGANGAMWIIRFNGATPSLLSSPKEFSGWLFSIQPMLSHGFPDIVLGWHMSAAEAGLSYFRFDGKSYHAIGAAQLLSDDNDNQKIVPRAR